MCNMCKYVQFGAEMMWHSLGYNSWMIIKTVIAFWELKYEFFLQPPSITPAFDLFKQF